MAYDPREDIFLLEEENLVYLFSYLRSFDRQRKIILSMVAYELRHRVQYQIPETILWTEDDLLLKDKKDAQEKTKRFKGTFSNITQERLTLWSSMLTS